MATENEPEFQKLYDPCWKLNPPIVFKNICVKVERFQPVQGLLRKDCHKSLPNIASKKVSALKVFNEDNYVPDQILLDCPPKSFHHDSTEKKCIKCEICGKSFTTRSVQKRHLLLHTGEKKFECDYCQRRFSQLSNLKSHVRTHTGEKPFLCKFCGERFARSDELKSHISNLHFKVGLKPSKQEINGKNPGLIHKTCFAL